MRKPTRAARDRDQTLQRFALAAIAAIVIAPLPFMVFQTVEIQHSARATLEAQLHGEDAQTGDLGDGPLLAGKTMHLEDAGQTELPSGEEALLEYVRENRDSLPRNEVLHFAGEGNFYFYLEAPDEMPDSSEDLVVRSVDITFAHRLALETLAVFIVVDILLAACLLIFQKRINAALDANDRIGQSFFANASHELKTPLTVITVQADGLRRDAVGKDEACTSIIEAAERMGGTVDSILQLSRIDAGVATPHLEPTDLRETLYDAIRAVEPLVEARGLKLAVALPRPLPCEADEDMLCSAFGNLLSNAARYAKTRISVTGRRAGSSLFVTIANDGAPLTEEEAARLFERFATGPGGQTGLGLSLAREYVELHNGSLTATPSKEGLEMQAILKRNPKPVPEEAR